MTWRWVSSQVAPVTGSPQHREIGTWGTVCLPCFKEVLESKKWTRFFITMRSPSWGHVELTCILSSLLWPQEEIPFEVKGKFFSSEKLIFFIQ